MGQLNLLTGEDEGDPPRLQGQQFGDAALVDRLRRRDEQRSMLKGRGSVVRDEIQHGIRSAIDAVPENDRGGRMKAYTEAGGDFQVHPQNLGLRDAVFADYAGGDNSPGPLPAPYEHGAQRRIGQPAWVMHDQITTAQGLVAKPRVQQLIDNPASGVNPRIPDELPYAVGYAARDADGVPQLRAGVIQGNHRVTAEALKGALFQRMRVVPLHDHSAAETAAYRDELDEKKAVAKLKHTAHKPRVQLRSQKG